MITDSEAAYNGIGYSGTNAGGNLIINDSVWHDNRIGIVPNSGDGEKLPPEHETTIVGNLVYRNNNAKSPAIDAARLGEFNGILIGGGNDNLVIRNRVHDHRIGGIVIVPNPDTTLWVSNGNRVEDNVVTKSAIGDLASVGGDGNCFVGNTFRTSKPADIEQTMPCTGTGIPATDPLRHRAVPRRQEATVGRLPHGEDATAAEAAGHEARQDGEGAAGEPHRGRRGPRRDHDAGAARPPALTATA